MERLATVCPHCGGPEQLGPSCVTCGELLWFQSPVPEDADDTAERHYPGLTDDPGHTVVRSVGAHPGAAGTVGAGSGPGAGQAGPAGPVEVGAGETTSGGRALRMAGTAAVLVVLAALVVGGWRFLDTQADPVADVAGTTEADPGADPGAGCTGQYVLVTPAATSVPEDCAALAAAVAEAATGGAAPAAYEGPFRSSRVACRRRDEIGGSEVHVRQLAEGAGPRLACACLISPRKLPDLGPVGVEGAGVGRGGSVSDAQVLLHEAGLNPDRLVGGAYGEQTQEWVRELQRRSGLPVTGRVDRDTWKALLGGCG